MPNERLVRWYVTVGLVDPPLSRRGRVAQYGRRHLLQLVAVKRRQADGRSLAEIQAELAGATDETLAAVARVPDARPAAEVPAPDGPADEGLTAEGAGAEAAGAEAAAAAPARFWARQPRRHGQPASTAGRPDQPGPGFAERPGSPAPAAAKGIGQLSRTAAEGLGRPGPGFAERRGQPGPSAMERPGRSGAAVVRGEHADGGAAPPPAGLVHGVRLAPGVTLLLEGGGREPGPEDVTEIVNAARPLLEELASRRLSAPGPGQPPDVPDQSPSRRATRRGSRT